MAQHGKKPKKAAGAKNLIRRGAVWYIKRMVDGQVLVQSTGETALGEAIKKRDRVLNPYNLREEKDRAEAALARVQTVEQKLAKAIDDLPALPVKDAWDAFLKSPARSDASEATMVSYLIKWKIFMAWIEARRPGGELRAVSVQDANDFSCMLMGKGLTPNTFNKYVGLFTMMFRVLADEARITVNPWTKIRRKRLNTQGRRALTVEELQKVLESATGELQTLLIIGAYSGLRLCDAVTLDWGEIDLDQGIITLRPKKTASRTGKFVGVPIHPTLHAALSQTPPNKRRSSVLPDLKKMWEENPDGINYRIKKHFSETCKIETTVPRKGGGKNRVALVGFHALRHTIVSQLASKGVPLEVIRGLVGHGGETMTRAYVHQSAEAARGAIGSLQALAPIQPPPKHTGASDEALASLAATLDCMTLSELQALASTVKKLIRDLKANGSANAVAGKQAGADGLIVAAAAGAAAVEECLPS